MTIGIKNPAYQSSILVILGIFTAVLCLAFSIRIQGISRIPEGQFTGSDAYFYYWQAQLVAEHGQLPERDMRRWLPLGRDLGQTLNLYAYTLAYTHKALVLLFPKLSLYHVAFYAPVVCFCIGLGVLCFFLHHTYGLVFSSVVGILLATLPGSIERSAAGFGDRDAFCLMIGILAVVTYLVSLQRSPARKRLIWTLTSGFIVFLGGISWEGFGVFLSVILIVELYRFLSSETEEGLGFYLLWMLCFVPTLYLASEAYRSGYGFARHLFAFMLVPPVVIFGIRTLRYLLILKVHRLHRCARPLALFLTLVSIALALGYVFVQYHTFADTTVALGSNKLMETVGELRRPHLKYWLFRYGSIFVFGSLGFIIASKRNWNRTFMLTPFILFIFTTFFREFFEKHLWNTSHNALFFFLILVSCTIAFLLTAMYQKSRENHQDIIVAFIAWFFIWGVLARDARRYDLFLGVALAVFTSEAIQYLACLLSEKIWHSKYMSEVFRKDMPTRRLKNCLTFAMIGLILFWPITGGHARRTYTAEKKIRLAFPGDTPVSQAFRWMKSELPHTAIVAAPWRYGSLLNVLGGVKTIIDQDHYIQQWIHLYNEYVHKVSKTRETLEFLKTHNATHLMVTQKHPPPGVKNATLNNVFLPVYPTDNFKKSMVKVWEIHYPSDIQPDLKYLKTGLPEIDAQLQLQ